MTDIYKRFKEIAYIKPKNNYPYDKSLKPKSEDIIFFISEELNEEDFKEPFFNKSQVMSLGDGFKFLTYCGKEANKNINKNALVITKKLKKDNKIIYRCYLMDKDNFNIRNLFSEYGGKKTIDKKTYSLNPLDYINSIKEEYDKKELIYIINQILTKLSEWSLKQK